jgi:molecular chaperone DnaK
MPQIEVTFDIDANGIVEVSAKDQATGKQQSIRITASSGLSQEEIDNLVREAELHGDEDRRQKALVEARNGADALIYQTEKSLSELGEQVPQDARMEIEGAVSQLKNAIKGDNTDEINRLPKC